MLRLLLSRVDSNNCLTLGSETTEVSHIDFIIKDTSFAMQTKYDKNTQSHSKSQNLATLRQDF